MTSLTHQRFLFFVCYDVEFQPLLLLSCLLPKLHPHHFIPALLPPPSRICHLVSPQDVKSYPLSFCLLCAFSVSMCSFAIYTIVSVTVWCQVEVAIKTRVPVYTSSLPLPSFTCLAFTGFILLWFDFLDLFGPTQLTCTADKLYKEASPLLTLAHHSLGFTFWFFILFTSNSTKH